MPNIIREFKSKTLTHTDSHLTSYILHLTPYTLHPNTTHIFLSILLVWERKFCLACRYSLLMKLELLSGQLWFSFSHLNIAYNDRVWFCSFSRKQSSFIIDFLMLSWVWESSQVELLVFSFVLDQTRTISQSIDSIGTQPNLLSTEK